MKKSEANKLLDKNFKERLKFYEFKKKGFRYMREYKDFIFDFGYALVDSDNSFPSTFSYSLKSLNIINLFIAIFSRNIEIRLFATGQIRLYEENKYPVLEYDIYTEDDALKMVDEVMEYMEKEALPFLESISDLKIIEKLINENPIPEKAHVGIVLAKLMGNPEYDNLKKTYKKLIKDWDGDYNPDFDKIVSFLDAHSHEELNQIAGL